MSDTFQTIARNSTGYFMNSGSKFYAYAFPVSDEAEAALFLQQIKKEHPKARHYCTALRLFPDASLERSSDDGEPSGSAGKPMLGQLVKNQLTNVYVVIARYFGGTKLGIPGLIEAYKTSTAEAIHTAEIVEKTVFGGARLEIPYEGYAAFQNYIRQKQIAIEDEVFADIVTLTIGFPQSKLKDLLLSTLKEFSQMDFEDLEAYERHLNIKILFLDKTWIR